MFECLFLVVWVTWQRLCRRSLLKCSRSTIPSQLLNHVSEVYWSFQFLHGGQHSIVKSKFLHVFGKFLHGVIFEAFVVINLCFDARCVLRIVWFSSQSGRHIFWSTFSLYVWFLFGGFCFQTFQLVQRDWRHAVLLICSLAVPDTYCYCYYQKPPKLWG